MRYLSLMLTALVLFSCGERRPSADELINKAETYYRDRKLVEALDHFQQYLKSYPEAEMASRSAFMIGFIYANDLKDTTKARDAYSNFLADYPNADAGLRASAEWELEHLGQDIGAMDFLEQGQGDAKKKTEERPKPVMPDIAPVKKHEKGGK